MKKIFTLVAIATAALTVSAQSQMGNFKDGASTLDEATSMDPVTLVKSANVTAGFPFKDIENSKGYKAGHIKCDVEAYVVITDSDGKKWIVDGNGATGNGNPRIAEGSKVSIDAVYPYTAPAVGVVFEFDIDNNFAYDSYATLAVVGKFGNNKNYLVYENGRAISYTLSVASKDFDTKNADVQKNYVIDEEKMKYVMTTVRVDPSDSKSAIDHYEKAETAGSIVGGLLGENTGCGMIDQYYDFIPSAGGKNGVGVIMFKVTKGKKYWVCGLGTKLTASGYVLLADDDPKTVELIRTKTEGEGDAAVTSQDQSIFVVKDYEPSEGGYEPFVTTLEECKNGESAVAGIAEAKAEVAAPVKVLTAKGVQIGKFNIAGQQVK